MPRAVLLAMNSEGTVEVAIVPHRSSCMGIVNGIRFPSFVAMCFQRSWAASTRARLPSFWPKMLMRRLVLPPSTLALSVVQGQQHDDLAVKLGLLTDDRAARSLIAFPYMSGQSGVLATLGLSTDSACESSVQQVLPPPPPTSGMLYLPATDDVSELTWGPSLPGAWQHMESPVLAQKAGFLGTPLSLRAATVVTYRLPCDVPFTLLVHVLARGSPKLWHKEGRSEFWNRRFLQLYRCPFLVVPIGELPRLVYFWQFLAMRFLGDGTSSQAPLGSPTVQSEGWFRAQWLQLRPADDVSCTCRDGSGHGMARS
jgi:hypothetical protein